jgi:hypothetical protein
MRFMLCARDRVTGEVTLLNSASFVTRREAVEAISTAGDFAALAALDVFLVDLDTAVPVAVVPWRGAESAPTHGLFSLDESPGIVPDEAASAPESPESPATSESPDSTDAAQSALPLEEDAVPEGAVFEVVPFDNVAPVDEASVPAEYDLDDAHAPMVFDMGASLGLVQIDIDEWTCEDCIYVSTCAFSGTRRPAACGAFQWRA